MDEEIKEVYVTRYALTDGIFKIKCKFVNGGYASQVKENGRNRERYFLSRNEYALTKEEAIEKANLKRMKKIKSINKQKAKIEKIDFEEQLKNI